MLVRQLPAAERTEGQRCVGASAHCSCGTSELRSGQTKHHLPPLRSLPVNCHSDITPPTTAVVTMLSRTAVAVARRATAAPALRRSIATTVVRRK